jgi:hypothetical protein
MSTDQKKVSSKPCCFFSPGNININPCSVQFYAKYVPNNLMTKKRDILFSAICCRHIAPYADLSTRRKDTYKVMANLGKKAI